MQVLLVEDDALLADGVSHLLRASAHVVTCAESAEVAAGFLARDDFDLMLLDIGLPGMDGMTFLTRLRAAHNNMLVMVLTARDALNEKVRGLTLGADDYLAKPFAGEELLARIQALCRRRDKPISQKRIHGPLILDQPSHRAWLSGVPLDLPLREWTVLDLLLDNVERVVSKERLVRRLCDWDQALSGNTIEIYISRLRAKLTSSGINIRTVRGIGYMLEAWQ
ncbi:MAG: response regulator transcription factor [Rhodocyclaceae bacterium]|nr:response regulator transcription factor [Rhodocyclaceae bacterium]